jgi:hypothetical protein
MRFMVLVPGNEQSEANVMPDASTIVGDMTTYNEELVKAGVMLSGEGLHPTSHGAKVRFDGDPSTGEVKRTVTDGPFTEAKELVAGYWILQCKSKEECIEWVRKAPFGGGTELEIREIYETEDFMRDHNLPDELKEREERLAVQLEAKQ